MNIILIIICAIATAGITQLFRKLGQDIERLNFRNWLLRNRYLGFLEIYSKYEKEKRVICQKKNL